jgi:DNA replication factor GINS
MDLDELRSVRRTERQKDSLQHLRDSFYSDVATYIQTRKAERRRAADAADDPFGDPEVGRLTDEIGTAEDVVEAVYERRVGKVVKLASFAAADMNADTSGLTVEEHALFDDLVERIKRNRQSILDTLAGEGGDSDADIDIDTEAPSPVDSGANPPTDESPGAAGVDATDADVEAAADPAPSAPDGSAGAGDDQPTPDVDPADDPPAPDDVLAAAMGGGGASTSGPEAGSESGLDAGQESGLDAGQEPGPDAGQESIPTEAVDDPGQEVPVVDGAETDGGSAAVTAGDATPEDDRVTLRITADVGRIYGVDEREYDLESEDVVRLPATNAGPLVERDAAERLE